MYILRSVRRDDIEDLHELSQLQVFKNKVVRFSEERSLKYYNGS